MKLSSLGIVFCLAFTASTASGANTELTQADSNKEVVASFYGLAFNQHKPHEAIQKYVGDKYIQHNPFVGDGKQPFIDFFVNFHKSHPKARTEIKRILGEGNSVIVHAHSKLDDDDRGRAVMDIFRLESGKIVEHWDVGQPVPEKSANDNTMF